MKRVGNLLTWLFLTGAFVFSAMTFDNLRDTSLIFGHSGVIDLVGMLVCVILAVFCFVMLIIVLVRHD